LTIDGYAIRRNSEEVGDCVQGYYAGGSIVRRQQADDRHVVYAKASNLSTEVEIRGEMASLVSTNSSPSLPRRSPLLIVVVQTLGGIRTPEDGGGGIAFLLDLTRAWQEAGHSVCLFTANPKFFSDRCDRGVAIEALPSPFLASGWSMNRFMREVLLNGFLQRRSLEDALRRRGDLNQDRPRLVLATSPYFSDLLALGKAVRTLSGEGAVYMYHEVPPPWWHPRLRGMPLRNSIAWLSYLFAFSIAKLKGFHTGYCQKSVANSVSSRFHANSFVTYGGAPSLHNQPLTPLNSRPNRVTAICRFAPSKGILDLIRAWIVVADSEPSAELLIAGPVQSESYLRRVRNAIHRAGVESSIRMLGQISALKKWEILQSSRVFVSASYEEGWAMSVMEALTYGAIPVAYDLPGYEHLGDMLLRVPVGDHKGLGIRVIDALHRTASPDRSQVNALLTNYSISRVAEAQIEQIQKLWPRSPLREPGGSPQT